MSIGLFTICFMLGLAALALLAMASKRRGRTLPTVLVLTICCAGWLAACKPADTQQKEPKATETPVPTAEAAPIDKQTPQMPTADEINAVRRADEYFYSEVMSAQPEYVFSGSMANLVGEPDSSDDTLDAVLSQTRQDGTAWREYIDSGNGALVKIQFDAECQPEMVYLGTQYGEGHFYAYIGVPFEGSEPCELLGGWQQRDGEASAQFAILDAARPLKLTNKQYRMLLHQCNTLAQAGVRNFATPADWTQDELESYLYYRAQYFDNTADALMIMKVDFSDTNDWNALPPYLTYDEMAALDWSAPKTDALLGYTAPEKLESDDPSGWQLTRDGDTVTAEWPGVQRYTFAVHDDEKTDFSRTVCMGGESLQ